MILTCATEGCENAGIPLTVPEPRDVEPGITVTRDAVCGVCGMQITDITEEPE